MTGVNIEETQDLPKAILTDRRFGKLGNGRREGRNRLNVFGCGAERYVSKFENPLTGEKKREA